MPKGDDANQAALRVVRELTDDPPATPPKRVRKKRKNPAAVALGKLGASKGGKARAESLSKKRRKEIASKAAAKRWEAHKAQEKD